MRKFIPEQQEFYCDRCKKRLVDSDDFFVEGTFVYRRKNIIKFGKNITRECKSIEMCESCTDEFNEFIGL